MLSNRDYRSGYGAYRAGRPDYCNPYSPGTPRYRDWARGWSEAEASDPTWKIAA